MRAVDIGVGHDDHAVVAKVLGIAILARAASQRQRQVGDFGIGADLVQAGRRDVQDLSADRQNRLGLAIARLLGAASGAVAFDNEQLGLAVAFARTIGQLAGKPHFLGIGGGLALDLPLGLALQSLFGALGDRG